MAKNKENEEVKNDKESKKLKNYLSLIIILAGLFIGSLFVDFLQLAKGEGISIRALNETEVFSKGDRTWVAYEDPIVDLTVITDTECEKCDVNEAVLGLRRVIPTMKTVEYDDDTEEGKALIEQLGIKSLPAFAFSSSITELAFFAQAGELFEKKDDLYFVDSNKLGMTPGKFLVTPEIGENDIVIGPENAKVTLVEYSEFQCPFCKRFHPTVKQILEEYKDDVKYTFKHFPLSFHLNARSASIASECAGDQGKFVEYGDTLFENQEEWSQEEAPEAIYDKYAKNLGLDVAEFKTCMTDGDFGYKIDQHMVEGAEFGVSGTPAMFINGQMVSGAVSFEELKAIIDEELAE